MGMRAHVRIRCPDGSLVELGHGDLIGRLWNAALHIDDARVSEAHALVSLRGGSLMLLALRGRFAVDQQPLAEVRLVAGMEVLLARSLSISIEEVVLPDHVLALEGDGLARMHLAGVCSIYAGSPPSVEHRHRGDADAWIWGTGDGWRLRTPDDGVRTLTAGDQWTLRGRELRVVAVPLESAGPARTRALGAVQAPLRLVAYFDTVHIHREGRPPLQLRGQAARILSELVACGVPIAWQGMAAQLWPEDADDTAHLRRRWDVALARLRSRLKGAGVRPDLVRADGSGLLELFLYDGDSAEDRT
jgi:hypothetical protein